MHPPFAILFAFIRLFVGWVLAALFAVHFALGWWMIAETCPVPLAVGVIWTSLLVATIYGSIPFAFVQLDKLKAQLGHPVRKAPTKAQ